MSAKAKPKSEPASDALRIERTFDAPRSLVFKMWSDGQHMAKWSAPKGFTIPDAAMDFRDGGKWRCHMRSPDGVDHRVQGVYREIVADERIVMTHAWLDEKGAPGPETLVTIEFEDDGGKTRMRFLQTGFASKASRDGHEGGWRECLDLLDAALQSAKGSPTMAKHETKLETSDRELVITRDFDFPPAIVFAAYADAKTIAKWWGPNGFSLTTHSREFREGGEWRFVMHGPDGRDYDNVVRYKKIVPNRLIAHDHGGDSASVSFEATTTFEDIGDGRTRVTLCSVFPTKEERDRVVREYGAEEGGKQHLARLAEHLAETSKIG